MSCGDKDRLKSFTNSARWVPDTEEVRNKQRVNRLRKEPEMAYKKPEVVAKSEAKQSFVAGCPTQRGSLSCTPSGRCQVAPTR